MAVSRQAKAPDAEACSATGFVALQLFLYLVIARFNAWAMKR